MPIKNYTTQVSANRSIEEIQSALVKHGATGVLYEYEQDTGWIAALQASGEWQGCWILVTRGVASVSRSAAAVAGQQVAW